MNGVQLTDFDQYLHGPVMLRNDLLAILRNEKSSLFHNTLSVYIIGYLVYDLGLLIVFMRLKVKG